MKILGPGLALVLAASCARLPTAQEACGHLSGDRLQLCLADWQRAVAADQAAHDEGMRALDRMEQRNRQLNCTSDPLGNISCY